MKDGKAAGTSGVVAEMQKAAGDTGIDLMTDLCNTIVAENTNPTKWDSSIILNCFKGKGATVERGNYRGLKGNCHHKLDAIWFYARKRYY